MVVRILKSIGVVEWMDVVVVFVCAKRVVNLVFRAYRTLFVTLVMNEAAGEMNIVVAFGDYGKVKCFEH
jgi:hypothetical protein